MVCDNMQLELTCLIVYQALLRPLYDQGLCNIPTFNFSNWTFRFHYIHLKLKPHCMQAQWWANVFGISSVTLALQLLLIFVVIAVRDVRSALGVGGIHRVVVAL